ncbi:putative phosphodiesterase I [Arabidopsis thaliana]
MIKALHCTFFFVSTVLRFVLQELNMSIHLYCVLRLSRSFPHQGLLRGFEPLNGTIHVVAGGGGASLDDFSCMQSSWSLLGDKDFGFVTLIVVDHSTIQFEYRRSSDAVIHDSFEIAREYKEILATFTL